MKCFETDKVIEQRETKKNVYSNQQNMTKKHAKVGLNEQDHHH